MPPNLFAAAKSGYSADMGKRHSLAAETHDNLIGYFSVNIK
jgi:hypothetical protein